MTAPADPPDIARSEYVHHCAAIGNAARNAHEALQRNDTSDAIWWLDQAHHWVEMAKAVAPSAVRWMPRLSPASSLSATERPHDPR